MPRDNESDIYVTDDDDSDAASPSPVSTGTVSNPRKRRAGPSTPTAPRARRSRRMEAGSPSTAGIVWADVKAIGGACPPQNCKSSIVEDPSNHHVFLVGGLRPDEKNEYPSSDLWCCDTTTMAWKDLTNALTFRTPHAPFSRAELQPTKTPIPRLTLPGCCLVKIGDRGFIFIIGGFDADLYQPSARVIVVDPDNLSWWYLEVEGNPLRPRIHPAVASVGDSVYVFGGYARLEPKCDPLPHNSFSILALNQDNDSWRWKVRDRPYSKPSHTNQLYINPIPQDHAFGAAIPLYNGKKILLLPGRHTEDDPISFTSANIFFYHVDNKTFQPATPNFAGDFPKNLGWHCSFEYISPADPAVNRAPNAIPYSSPNSPSVVIGGWTKLQDQFVSELWHLLFSPEDRIHCHKFAQHISDLSRDFESDLLIWVKGRPRLLGSKPTQGGDEGIPYLDAYVDLPV